MNDRWTSAFVVALQPLLSELDYPLGLPGSCGGVPLLASTT